MNDSPERAPSEGPTKEGIEVRLEWGDQMEATPIHFSDQLIASYRNDYVVLTIGQVAQPQLLPGDREGLARLRERGSIPIRTQFRTAIPASSFEEFLRGIVRVARAQGAQLTESEESNDGDDR